MSFQTSSFNPWTKQIRVRTDRVRGRVLMARSASVAPCENGRVPQLGRIYRQQGNTSSAISQTPLMDPQWISWNSWKIGTVRTKLLLFTSLWSLSLQITSEICVLMPDCLDRTLGLFLTRRVKCWCFFKAAAADLWPSANAKVSFIRLKSGFFLSIQGK